MSVDESLSIQIVNSFSVDGRDYWDDLWNRAMALRPQMHPDDTMATRMQFLREQDAKATVN